MTRVRVDPTKCQGYAICVEEAGGNFSLDDWGFAQAEPVEVPESEIGRVNVAIKECPVNAIRWVRPPTPPRPTN